MKEHIGKYFDVSELKKLSFTSEESGRKRYCSMR
jgi:hypothetical protein